MKPQEENTPNEIFSLNLRAAMSDFGFNQKRLSEVSGIPQGTLSNYMRAARSPSVEQLMKLSSVFEVPVNYFFSTEECPWEEGITHAAGLAAEAAMREDPAEYDTSAELKRMAHNLNVAMNENHKLREHIKSYEQRGELADLLVSAVGSASDEVESLKAENAALKKKLASIRKLSEG